MELMTQKKVNKKNLLFDVMSKFMTINFGTVAQTLMMTGGKYLSDSSDSFEDLFEDCKRMHNIWIVKYEEEEDRSYNGQVENSVGLLGFNENDFMNSFERLWQKYVAIGVSIFAASIFFNILMCIYWSAGYKFNEENVKEEVTKIILSESELTETE
eukprot:743140_1